LPRNTTQSKGTRVTTWNSIRPVSRMPGRGGSGKGVTAPASFLPRIAGTVRHSERMYRTALAV